MVTPFPLENWIDLIRCRRMTGCFHQKENCFCQGRTGSGSVNYCSGGSHFWEGENNSAGHCSLTRQYSLTEVNNLVCHHFCYPLALEVVYIWAGHPACILMETLMACHFRMAVYHPLAEPVDKACNRFWVCSPDDPVVDLALGCQYQCLAELLSVMVLTESGRADTGQHPV